MGNGKIALIAGASGLVGGELLQLLLNDADYKEVRVLGRSSVEIKHPKLKEELLHFEDLDQFAHCFEGVDAAFCCLGTTIKKAGSEEAFMKVDQEYPLQLAQICREKNVPHFLIVTAMGADSGSMIFYNKVKGMVEEAIKDLKLESTSIFRPSLLLGDRKEFRLGEKLGSAFMKLTAPFMIGPLSKFKAIQAKAVAKSMLKIAENEKAGFHIYESDELQNLGK